MSLAYQLQRIAREYGFVQRKRLSQSFLIDEGVLAREAEYASPEGKLVLEVGPGFGFLTRKLSEAGARKIIAVEKDARLIPILKKELSDCSNVELIHGDFLEGAYEAEVVVSNVPYSISSPFLFKLAGMRFEHAILCLQKEFVERMLAQPGAKEYSRLSVTAQTCFRIRLIEIVPRTAFYPPPKVDSAIIELRPTGKKVEDDVGRLILLLFQHKKKTVRAALADAAEELGISKENARKIAEELGFADRRIFTLSRDDFSHIAHILKNQ